MEYAIEIPTTSTEVVVFCRQGTCVDVRTGKLVLLLHPTDGFSIITITETEDVDNERP